MFGWDLTRCNLHIKIPVLHNLSLNQTIPKDLKLNTAAIFEWKSFS